MADYAKMYAILCAAASEALDALPETAENAEGRRLLQAALYQAEELYVAAEDGTAAEGEKHFCERRAHHR